MSLLTALLLLAGSVAGIWPLDPPPPVVHPFVPPSQVWGAGHRGVDLLGVPGQEVGAAAAGTVTFAGQIAGVGIVVVSHGDTRSTYQPVAAFVTVGQVVEPGAPLGVLEQAGSHCLPQACLHWGLVRGTEYLDPLSMIGATSQVRLLPLDSPLDSAAVAPADPDSTRQIAAAIVELLSRGLRGTAGGPSLVMPADVPAGTPSAAGPP